MRYLKTFEYTFRNGKPVTTPKNIYIIFDDDKGYTLNKELARKQKFELLNIFKEYYNMDETDEKYAMNEYAWAWNISFYKNSISISIVTTNGWLISTNAIVIEAKEFIIVGLEELDTYINAKKYNL
jgi:hypothetical protein